MTYDNWKTTNPDDCQLGEDPEHVPTELNQAEWYEQVYLPNVKRALRGEHVDRALLCGNDDLGQPTADELYNTWEDRQ